MTTDADRQTRAGDYVLGLMSEEERERAQRDLENDPAFRDAVMRLTDRLRRLDREIRPTAIPADVWSGIETQLAGMPQMKGLRVAAPVASPQPAGRPDGRAGMPRIGDRQGWLTAAALVVACLLGYGAGLLGADRGTPAIAAAAVLETPAGVPGALVEIISGDAMRVVTLDGLIAPEGSVLQLWTFNGPAAAPVMVATLSQSGRATFRTASPAVPGQTYQITHEPAPGSPTGRPSGPVLVKGVLQSLAGS